LTLPLGVSTVVLGIGFIFTFGDGFFPLRNSWVITPIAQSLTLIPLVVQILQPRRAALPIELEEMAALEKASPLHYKWFIELPLLRSSLITVIAYLIAISIGEFGAASFLATGDQATLPVLLYQLLGRPGEVNFGMALAASTLLTLLIAAIALVSDYYEMRSDSSSA
jgi:thiamine transport system permease protein